MKKSTIILSFISLLLLVLSGFSTELIRYDFETGTTAVNAGNPEFSSTTQTSGMSVHIDDTVNAKFGMGYAKGRNHAAADYFSITDLTGSRAELNTALSSFSFSIFVKPEAASVGKDLFLFTRRGRLANKAGEITFNWLGDGRPRLKWFPADGEMVQVALGKVNPNFFTADQYIQLGFTFDGVAGEVVFYVNGKPYSRKASISLEAIPEITENPAKAYIRVASTVTGAGPICYDNIIYDVGTVYSAEQMASIYEKGSVGSSRP